MIIQLNPNQSKPQEVSDMKYLDPQKGNKVQQVVEQYLIDPITKKIHLVWEYIFSFIFSKDGFGIQTKDGYIIKCKDQ